MYQKYFKIFRNRSFGCVIYEILTLQKLFDGKIDYEIKDKIQKFDQKADLESLKSYDHELPEITNLIRR